MVQISSIDNESLHITKSGETFIGDQGRGYSLSVKINIYYTILIGMYSNSNNNNNSKYVTILSTKECEEKINKTLKTIWVSRNSIDIVYYFAMFSKKIEYCHIFQMKISYILYLYINM